MLTGLLEPTEGRILFQGRNIRDDLPVRLYELLAARIAALALLLALLVAAITVFAIGGALLTFSWLHRRPASKVRFDAEAADPAPGSELSSLTVTC